MKDLEIKNSTTSRRSESLEDKQNIKHYLVSAVNLRDVLTKLDSLGYSFKEFPNVKAPIWKYFTEAVNRDYGTMTPVLIIENWKTYRFVTITTDRILGINKDSNQIYSFEEFQEEVINSKQ